MCANENSTFYKLEEIPSELVTLTVHYTETVVLTKVCSKDTSLEYSDSRFQPAHMYTIFFESINFFFFQHIPRFAFVLKSDQSFDCKIYNDNSKLVKLLTLYYI